MHINTRPQDVVLVTGGSAGIGAEIAREFARRGRRVLLVARSAERLADTADAIMQQTGETVDVLVQDLAEPGAFDGIDRFLEERGQRVQTLVNCAGWGRIGPFLGQDRLDVPSMIDLNCRVLAEACHRYLPQVIASRGGILNVASVAGFLPGPGMNVYFASKAFVVSLTQSLAYELSGFDVRVSALCPGPSPTRFQSRAGMHGGRSRPLLTCDPSDIARIGVRGHLAGRTIIVPGFWNKLLALGGKYIPHRLMMPFVARYHRLESGHGLRGALSALDLGAKDAKPEAGRPSRS